MFCQLIDVGKWMIVKSYRGNIGNSFVEGLLFLLAECLDRGSIFSYIMGWELLAEPYEAVCKKSLSSCRMMPSCLRYAFKYDGGWFEVQVYQTP
jgi:hypothetical protein